MIPSMTFAELKKKVQLFIGRKDEETIEQIPFFINLAEKQIYRNLRIPEFEETAVVVVGANGSSTYPEDLLDFKHLYTGITKNPGDRNVDVLIRCSLSTLNSDTNGFAQVDNLLWFTKDLPEGTEVSIAYYKAQDELLDEEDTCILLDIAPDVLLYATLSVAARFNNDAEDQERWAQLYESRITQLFQKDLNFEYSGGTLAIQQRSSRY